MFDIALSRLYPYINYVKKEMQLKIHKPYTVAYSLLRERFGQPFCTLFNNIFIFVLFIVLKSINWDFFCH